MELSTPIASCTRVGKAIATRFKRLGIVTVGDLLWHIPFRYEDWSAVVPIAELSKYEHATIRGRIELLNTRRSFKRRLSLTEAVVADDTGSIKVVWFNQPYLSKTLHVGDEISLAGKLEQGKYGLQLSSPTWERAGGSATHTARVVPVYSTTAGLTQKQIRFLVKEIEPIFSLVQDWLPGTVKKQAKVPQLHEALHTLHFPKTMEDAQRALERLQFDELLRLQLVGMRSRQFLERAQAPLIPFFEERTREFVSRLPFMLTLSQKKAAWEIFKDIQKSRPMNRLLEGDVGSGKTVVSMLASLGAAWSGYQTAFLAPTEILAAQHFVTFSKLCKGAGYSVLLFTRALRTFIDASSKKKENITKKEALKLLSDGAATVVIGTHALLEGTVQFKNLGLAIVDEQHRFGVEQRKRLRSKTGHPLFPHFLSLTATPIPRTLALSIYGDLDLSLLTDKPVGRKPIKTRLVEPHNREKAYQFVRDQVREGRQVFVVCPLIDASDTVGAKAVTTETKRLQKEVFPSLTIEMLHGKMSAQEKEKRMTAFLRHEFDILVATSVVEVGVDIPNASVMMIEGAERFGLAQLHQFRGRVGRSEHQSYCFLFESDDAPDTTKERLKFLESTTDGFKLAEKDLELRGMGSLFGFEQSGFDSIKFADFKNPELIKRARETAQWILSQGLETFPTVEQQVHHMERDVHAE